MKLLRNTLTVMACCLLLSFNTLAAALLAVDQCMQHGQSDPRQMVDMADMQSHEDCASAEQSWLSATAQLLCDQGGNCQMGGTAVPSAGVLAAASPQSALPVLAKPGLLLIYPAVFWRPPRH
jgi:uncharacterized membrane protein